MPLSATVRIENAWKIKEDARTSSVNLLGERGLKVTFWGVRGSFPCPRLSHIRYGGNTSCVSVQCGNQSIVFDAGTGIRGFGQWLMQQPQRRLHILLSHVHWDHINGFPFFDPVYKSEFNIHVWAGSLSKQGQSIQAIMSQQMQGPTFPIVLESLPASLQFTDFKAGETFDLEGVSASEPLPSPTQITRPLIALTTKVHRFVTSRTQSIARVHRTPEFSRLFKAPTSWCTTRRTQMQNTRPASDGGTRLGRKVSGSLQPQMRGGSLFFIMIPTTMMTSWIRLPLKQQTSGPEPLLPPKGQSSS